MTSHRRASWHTARLNTTNLPWLSSTKNSTELNLRLSLIIRPTVSRPVCLGIKHPSGAYDQIFSTVDNYGLVLCGAPSLTRRRVCLLYLLLALASAVFPWSESLRTRDHILLSQIWDFPFRRLLRLAGSRWRYSTTPPHGSLPLNCWCYSRHIASARTTHRKHLLL
jgi:hypothetical protein